MPKATLPTLPLSGLIAFQKPSGPTSNAILDSLKHLFADSPLFASTESAGGPGGGGGGPKGKNKGKGKGGAPGGVKMGQGGTLDPLADGVLVVGVNRGTKQLSRFLLCSKEYRTTAILGCSTDSYDSMGAIDAVAKWEHVTPELIETVLDRFRGDIMQMPPVYSALKMDGKPLYEYARLGLPLPRPVEARKCTVHELVLESFQPSRSVEPEGGHVFDWPTKWLADDERANAEKAKRLVNQAAAAAAAGTEGLSSTTEEESQNEPAQQPPSVDRTRPTVIPPTFTLRMTVSSGTYVRSIVHDVAQAVSSLAHVVVLTRTRQGEFAMEAGNVVPWSSVQADAEEEERRFQEERPRKLAEKTRRREELKAKQKEKVAADRAAKKAAAQKPAAGDAEEEAMNNVGASPSTPSAVPAQVEMVEQPKEEVKTELEETKVEPKKRRGMDDLREWEKEILAKFEEHLE